MAYGSLEKGVIANLNPTIEICRGGVINYDSGNSLGYAPLGGHKRDFRFTYDDGHETCFNDMLGPGFRFVPVDSSSRLCLQESGESVKRFPEVQASIPQLEDELRVIDILHEISHGKEYLTLEGVLKGTATAPPVLDEYISRYSLKGSSPPQPRLNGRLAERLAQTHRYFTGLLTEDGFDRLLENSAWNYALAKKDELGLLKGISDSAIHDHIAERLGTYGIYGLDRETRFF